MTRPTRPNGDSDENPELQPTERDEKFRDKGRGTQGNGKRDEPPPEE